MLSDCKPGHCFGSAAGGSLGKAMVTAFFFATLPCAIGTPLHYNFVVWNVGQGSWSTFIDSQTCYHFDMGGEKVSWKPLLNICRRRKNQLLLTHQDWDHIRYVKRFASQVKNFCFFPFQHKIGATLRHLKRCKELSSKITIISTGNPQGDANASSHVYLIKQKVLITGDAPMSEEKKWTQNIPKRLSLLILGHHGSHTSTSVDLLKRSHPKLAIASARKSKYGHPHKKVVAKLKKQKVPVLETETYGNIYMKLK